MNKPFRILNFMRAAAALLAALACLAPATGHAERLKDLASIQGVRSNQLIGYGLVVGLDGTGDQTTQTPFTVQSIISTYRFRASSCRESYGYRSLAVRWPSPLRSALTASSVTLFGPLKGANE